jgi:hypothetical protein
MKMVKNNKIIKCLAALLIGAAGTAFAGTSCGTNMEYEIVGTELRLTSPDPTSPATINSQAFINRTDFTEISMPDNVTVINTKAFEGCTALTSVVIPPSVTEIGVEAFKGCTNLHSVLCRPQTPPALLGTDGFTNCHESLQICVSALGLYKAATNWSNYTDKLCLCYLDENDERETVAAKLKSFRDAAKNDIDIFRTLRKAGCFNTLTLPFNVPEIAASPLSGAEVYTFTSATVEDGTLQLDITPVLSNGLTAGTPYLIQWDNTGEVLTLMHFTDITWDEDNNASHAGTGDVSYAGFYGKTHINDETEAEQHLNLFLGGGNQLYWPSDGDDANAKMLGFRAWFRINGSSVSGAPVRRGMPAMLRIVATPTAINETAADSSSLQGGDRGRLILRNGQLVIIRNGQTFSLNGQKL